MSRHNRDRREQAAAAVPRRRRRRRGPPRWFVAVLYTGSFAFTAAFASNAVFLGVVQPLVAPIAYTSTDGEMIGYHPSPHPGIARDFNCTQVSYSVEGRAFTCVAAENPGAWRDKGQVLRVYYPPDRPDRGFVCDWVGERRWWVSTSPLALFCLPFLLIGLVWYWLAVAGMRTPIFRAVGVPLGLWFTGLVAGGAIGMVLVADPKSMNHPVPAVLLQIAGGVAGGLWGLRVGNRPALSEAE